MLSTIILLAREGSENQIVEPIFKMSNLSLFFHSMIVNGFCLCGIRFSKFLRNVFLEVVKIEDLNFGNP